MIREDHRILAVLVRHCIQPVYSPVYGSVHSPVYGPVYTPGYCPVYSPVYSTVYGPVYSLCTALCTEVVQSEFTGALRVSRQLPLSEIEFALSEPGG